MDVQGLRLQIHHQADIDFLLQRLLRDVRVTVGPNAVIKKEIEVNIATQPVIIIRSHFLAINGAADDIGIGDNPAAAAAHAGGAGNHKVDE